MEKAEELSDNVDQHDDEDNNDADRHRYHPRHHYPYNDGEDNVDQV